jgi:hypothetical protein
MKVQEIEVEKKQMNRFRIVSPPVEREFKLAKDADGVACDRRFLESLNRIPMQKK